MAEDSGEGPVDYGTWSGNEPIKQEKQGKQKMSRRDFLRGAGAGGAVYTIGRVPGLRWLGRQTEASDQSRNAKTETITSQTEVELPKYSDCSYVLSENSLQLRTRLATGESRNLEIAIEHRNFPIAESGYRPTEFEVVIDDSLNPNYNCHSFSSEQVTGIEDLGEDSNVWIDNPQMKQFLDTFGTEVFNSGLYEQPGFHLPDELEEGDLLALVDQKGMLLHTGVYHTEFRGVDTSSSPYISKFGGDKLMGRGLESTIRNYWIQQNDDETLRLVAYRFDESFNFHPSQAR